MGDDDGMSGGAGSGGASGASGGGVGGTAGSVTGGSPSGGNSTGGKGTGGFITGPPCVAANPWSPGIDLCEGNYVIRHTVESCPEPSPETGEGGGGGAGGEGGASTAECVNDAQCPNGSHCVGKLGQPDYVKRCIAHACELDADCGPASICVCQPGYVKGDADREIRLGTCVHAGCRSDADCARTYHCASPLDFGEAEEFHCQTARDECHSDDDCDPDDGNDDCRHDGSRMVCL